MNRRWMSEDADAAEREAVRLDEAADEWGRETGRPGVDVAYATGQRDARRDEADEQRWRAEQYRNGVDPDA